VEHKKTITPEEKAYETQRAKEKIQYTIGQIYLKGGFYSRILKRLNVGISWSCSTAYVNFRGIWFSPFFIKNLSKEEMVFLMCHEILHVAFLHDRRRLDKIPKIWNYACDYSINWILIEDTVGKFIEGGLKKEEFKGLTSEEIYDIIKDDSESHSLEIEDLCDTDGEGELVQTGDFGEMEEGTADQIIDTEIENERSSQSSSKALRKYLEENYTSHVDWRAILSEFLERSSRKTKYMLPDRRHMHTGTYLYKLKRKKIPGLTGFSIAVDPSGSMGLDEMVAILGEIAELLKIFDARDIRVFWGDGEDIHESLISSPEDVQRLKDLPGGGGHDYQVMMDYIEAKGTPRSTTALIYFTDGENPEPLKPVWCDKVVWFCTGEMRFDWGKIVNYTR
jgi:predicted metal-dependent peptidase